MPPLHFQCIPDFSTEPVTMLTYPREETTSGSVIFWAAAFIAVDVLWAVSALFLDERIAGEIKSYILMLV